MEKQFIRIQIIKPEVHMDAIQKNNIDDLNNNDVSASWY